MKLSEIKYLIQICFLLAFVEVFGFSIIKAQIPHFKEYSLPNSAKANLMIQDQQGFLWIGTNKGLYSFDGVNWTLIQREDSLGRQEVTALFEDRDGIIWTGFKDGGIFHVDDKELIPFSPEEGLPKVEVSGFSEDKDGNIWFSTYGEGLYYLYHNRLYNYDVTDGLPDNEIYTINRDYLGRIWVGTDRGIGICYLSNGEKKIEILNQNHGLRDNIVRKIIPQNQGMWIGMYDHGVSYYDISQSEFTHFDGWDYGTANSLILLGEEVWIGTERSGLIGLENDSYRLLNFDYKKIQDFLEDQEGNIWLADHSDKLKMTNKAIMYVPEAKSNILSIHHGSDQRLWFGTEKGLNLFDIKKQKITLIFNNPQAHITCIYEDTSRKDLWFGTLGDGIWKIDLKTNQLRHFQEKDGLSNEHVMSIVGNDSEIWFGTFGGVSRINPEKKIIEFENFNSKNGLSSDYIYKVMIGQDGRTWFATDGKGICYWENGRIHALSNLSDQTILSMAESSDGNIWFSTDRGDIYIYDGSSFELFPTYQTHIDQIPTAMIAINQNDLVVTYKDHIDLIYPKSEKSILFDLETGVLPFGEDLNVIDKDIRGNIWIGTNQGIICLNFPSKTILSHPLPRIKQVKIYLEDIGGQNPMKLSYNQNHLIFEFVGLWLQAPQSVHYEYRLKGYDLDWISTKDHQAVFANLTNGTYEFQLRARNNLTLAYSPTTTYKFRILKPIWRKWWFNLLGIALGIFLIQQWVKIREERVKNAERLEKEKMESRFETLQSQINPHFLFNSFNTLISIIEEDNDNAVEYVEKLSDFFRNILAYRDRQLISLKEELELFEDFLYLQKKRYGEKFQLTIEINPELYDRGIPTLSLQLLVENAFKHNIVSSSKPLKINIEAKSDDYLTVKNNLQLRKYEPPSTKIGLENIAQRYQLLTQKEVKIEVNEEIFSVHIPLLNLIVS